MTESRLGPRLVQVLKFRVLATCCFLPQFSSAEETQLVVVMVVFQGPELCILFSLGWRKNTGEEEAEREAAKWVRVYEGSRTLTVWMRGMQGKAQTKLPYLLIFKCT